MSQLAKGGLGGWAANRANWANHVNPRPTKLASAHQVTLQVTYGMGC